MWLLTNYGCDLTSLGGLTYVSKSLQIILITSQVWHSIEMFYHFYLKVYNFLFIVLKLEYHGYTYEIRARKIVISHHTIIITNMYWFSLWWHSNFTLFHTSLLLYLSGRSGGDNLVLDRWGNKGRPESVFCSVQVQ